MRLIKNQQVTFVTEFIMKKILLSLSVICTMATSTLAQKAKIATWKNNSKAAYTIVHDDYGDPSVDGIWEYADTIAANRDIKFTIGAISGSCETKRDINGYEDPYAYAKDVMMAQHGHEVMSHSHTHSCAVGNAGWWPCEDDGWGELNDFADEIVGCTESIEEGTGHKPQYYIFPYDRFTNSSNDKLKELGYIGSRTGWTSPLEEEFYRDGYNDNDLNTFYPDADGFFRTSVQVFDDKDADSPNHAEILNAEVDEAIANSEWANRELHNVGERGWGYVSVEGYRAHLDYLKSKVEKGDLWVGTVSEILTYQMQKLKYEASISEVEDLAWLVEWNDINPTYNVDVAEYLKDLSYTSPITLTVDLEGRTGIWEITQSENPVEYEIIEGVLYTNVYPHEGAVKINLLEETHPAPVVEYPIGDQKLPVDFTAYTIDLNMVFEDANTKDENLIYAAEGNTEVVISIENGVASISAPSEYSGTEVVTFSAQDESEQIVLEEVSFIVDGVNEPYSGTPITVPSKFETEDYDKGGELVAFEEVDDYMIDNYREDAVDIKSGTGYTVLMEDGEWLEYTINVALEGAYDVEIFSSSMEENATIDLSVDKEALSSVPIKKTEEGIFASNKIYNVQLSSGEHVLRIFANGKLETDFVNVTETGDNALPIVSSSIPNQELFVDFTTYVIDLKEVFEDVETLDTDLIYSVSGNSNIKVEIVNGAATLSPTIGWEGEEILSFTAKDAAGEMVSDEVLFEVNPSFAMPNETVDNGEGYIFTFDESNALNCPETMIPHKFIDNERGGYKLESVGGGNLVISTDGTHYGTDNFTIGLNDDCVESMIDLSHPGKRMIEVRLFSTVDVPEFLALVGDVDTVLADYDVLRLPIEANKWQTISFPFNSMDTWGGSTMDSTKVMTLSLMFRKNYGKRKQDVAGTFTIDYIKIGGAVDPCPNPVVLSPPVYQAIEEGEGAMFEVDAYGGELTYEWHKGEFAIFDNDNVSGSLTSKLTIGQASDIDVASYYCEITDACGSSIKTEPVRLAYSNSNKPFSGTAISLPGKFEAEHFDLGGQGVAYVDINGEWDPVNEFRDEEVDLEESDNGYTIGYVKKGEWLEYTVNVVESGTYQIDVSAAATSSSQVAKFTIEGDTIARVAIEKTGGWSNFKLSSDRNVELEAGEHVIRLNFSGSFNVDYIDVKNVTGFPLVNDVADVEVLKGSEQIITIDLNEAFEDEVTIDSELEYSFSGNTFLVVELVEGLVTITDPLEFIGQETITFTATDEDGNSSSFDVGVEIKEDITSLASNSAVGNSFVIYPNPTTSFINILTDDQVQVIEVYDISGFKMNVETSKNIIDLSDLPEGIYFVKQGHRVSKIIKEG